MKELLDAASSVEEPDRPNPVVEFVTDKSLWGVWKACCRHNHSKGDGLFATVLSMTYDVMFPVFIKRALSIISPVFNPPYSYFL